MKRINFKDRRDQIIYQGAEIGIWDNKLFVPIESIQLMIFEKEGEPIHWIAYSPLMQWGYITEEADDFTQFLDATVKFKQTHEVEDGKRTSKMFYLKNGLFLHYSYRTSLLLDWENNADKKNKIQNKLWIETYGFTQNLIASEGPDIKTWEEDEILKKGPFDFTWGGFYRQEELPQRNPLSIIIMILAALLGFWMGCQEDKYLYEIIWLVPF